MWWLPRFLPTNCSPRLTAVRASPAVRRRGKPRGKLRIRGHTKGEMENLAKVTMNPGGRRRRKTEIVINQRRKIVTKIKTKRRALRVPQKRMGLKQGASRRQTVILW